MEAVQRKTNEAVNQPDRISVVPSGAALGAEIRGMDLSQPVPDEIKVLLRKAWADHLVLFWRGQHLPDEALLAAAGIFGPTKEPAARKYQVAGGYKVGGKLVPLHSHLTLISNLDEDGVPVKDNGTLGSYEVVWHSDNSYVEVPPAGSMLYSVIIPVNGGGDTWFNNQYQAYDELPQDLKAAIQGKSQIHDASRNSAGVLRPTVKLPTRPEEVPGPAHPLVRVHPMTGKRALYLGRRRDWPSNYIIGMPNDESEALLDRLWTHATQPKYAWKHAWQVGDLVLWDNRCAMHYRSEVDASQPRVLHRTVIRGEAVIPG
ncbi:MAG: TauD/TfdA family dioxygenase [Burkholderiales bacterium]|nr:TauD/TfdA family dioxygenase [Burkholderiales bacterium]MCW5603369.1 TauD/TfdA family dioxygenase [Burkholderiales bacterium]